MEKVYPLGNFQQPSRQEILETYIDTLTTRDTDYITDITRQIENPHLPLTATQVLIPVAAHQEADGISHALEQYAQQQTDQPFTVILSLNSPSSQQDNPEINRSIAAIEQVRHHYPMFDVRYALSFYDEPTIGMIRRDLWNSALISSHKQGLYNKPNDEVIGINHDIDLVSMSPRYIQRIQSHYERRQHTFEQHRVVAPLGMARTGIRHALSPEHPNISKGILWSDFTNRQMNASYEAGLVFPLSYYAQYGGFRSTSLTHETRPLAINTPRVRHIPGTAMQTSPRRYVERLRYGYDKVWTNETFSAADTCRSKDMVSPDISFDELEAIIDKDTQLTDTIYAMSAIAANTYASKQDEMALIENTVAAYNQKVRTDLERFSRAKIHLASEVLARVIASPSLAAKARSLHDNKRFHKKLEYLFLGPTNS